MATGQVDVRRLAAAIYGAIHDYHNGGTPDHVCYNLAGLLARCFGQHAPDAELVAELYRVSDMSAGLDAAEAEMVRNSDGADSVNLSELLERWLAAQEPFRVAMVRQAATAAPAIAVRFLAHYVPEETGMWGSDYARQIIQANGLAFCRFRSLHSLDAGEPGETVSLSIVEGTPREEVVSMLKALTAFIESTPDALTVGPSE